MIVRRNLRSFINSIMLFACLHCCMCFVLSLLPSMDKGFYYVLALVFFVPCLLIFFGKSIFKNFSALFSVYLAFLLLALFIPGSVPLKIVLSAGIVATFAIHYSVILKDSFDMGLPFSAVFVVAFLLGVKFERSDLLLNICFFEMIVYIFLFFSLKGIIAADNFLLSNSDETINANLSRIHKITNAISFTFAFITCFAMSLLAFVGNEPLFSFLPPLKTSTRELVVRSLTQDISNSPLKRWAKGGQTSITVPDSMVNLFEYTVLILISIVVLVVLFKAVIRIIRTFNLRLKKEKSTLQDEISFIPIHKEIRTHGFEREKHTMFFTNEAKLRRIYKKYILKHRSAPENSLTPSEIMQGIEEKFNKKEITELYEKVRFGADECCSHDVEQMKKLTKKT